MGTFQDVWSLYKEHGDEEQVHRSVVRDLGADADAPVVAEFARELERFLEDEDALLLMLSAGLNGAFESPLSFLGLLLREEVLQSRLVDLLLDKLAEFAAAVDAQLLDRNVPKLILRELRWMDLVVDSRQVIEKLIGALPAFPPSLQQEVIYILPELASDEDAVTVVNALLDLIRSEAGMVVCCIEALGNFNVFNDQTSAVLHCILERLDSSPLSDLPVIVKYLIQEAPGIDVEQVAEQVRAKISTMLTFSPESAVETGRAEREEEALILGSIVQGMHFRDDLMKAFVTQMQSAAEWLLMDVWLLVGAHSIPQHRVKMEKVLVKKVKAGVISSRLIARAILDHGNAMKPYFTSLLELASALLAQSANSECQQLGSTIYQVLFEEFSRQQGVSGTNSQSSFYQGEIVSAILTHCLATGTTATTVGMDTLLSLVSGSSSAAQRQSPSNRRDIYALAFASSMSERRQRLKVFLPSLKQMLDTMELYNPGQIRRMYDILFAIGGHDDADLCNVLRKQGFHQHIRYRYFGIIGTIARLRRILEHFRESDQDGANPSSTSEASVAKAFNAILVELHTSCKSHAQCISFMLDELAILVENLTLDKYADTLVTIIFDYNMDTLSTQFMDDFDWTKKTDGTYTKSVLNGAMKSELWLGLEEKLSPVYLKILDLVVSPNVVERESLLYLTSLVSLVMLCARKRKQVSEIECILICPLQLMEESVVPELAALDDHTVQNAVCSSIWFAINWTRSVLNFFASEKKDFYVSKVMQRLEDLSRLESLLLDETLEAAPMFAVPGSVHATDAAATGKNKLGKPEVKKRGRPAKNAKDVDRVSLIKSSFVPLQAEVLNILSFPDLLHDSKSNAPLESLTLDEKNLSRVDLLFGLLASYVETSCELEKKKSSSHWTLSKPAVIDSGDWLSAHSSTKSATELLQDLSKAGVLSAAARFAREFKTRIARILHNQEGDEESKQEDDPGASEAIESMARHVVSLYLRVVAAVVNHKFVESGNEDESLEDYSESILHLKQLILPHVEVVSDPTSNNKDALIEVVAKCFDSIKEYETIIEDELSTIVALLKCLTSLLSLIYGFDSSHFVSKTPVIDLQGGSGNQTTGVELLNQSTIRMANAISALALTALESDWTHGDPKYVHPTAQLEFLLRCHIYHGNIILDNIQSLALAGFEQLLEQNGKRSEALPTLDKKTITVYHRVMFSALVDATARIDLVANDSAIIFNYLGQAVLLFKLLVCLTKSFHKSMIVATVLKSGRKFVETILQVMPFFEQQFQENMDRVIKLITDVQVATRRIQVLCAHGKLIKDQATASQVPKVKKLLEKLIYRSEALASANGILEFYSTGVLKNRRIDGTAISKEELEGSSESESEQDNEVGEGEEVDNQDDTESEDEETQEADENVEADGDEPPSKRR